MSRKIRVDTGLSKNAFGINQPYRRKEGLKMLNRSGGAFEFIKKLGIESMFLKN